MSGNKPAIRITCKRRGGDGRVGLFAFWRRDDGKMSGGMERRVKRIVVLMDDGTKIDIQRTGEKETTHYIDCWEEREPHQERRHAFRGNRGNHGNQPRQRQAPPDDLLGDASAPDGEGNPSDLDDIL